MIEITVLIICFKFMHPSSKLFLIQIPLANKTKQMLGGREASEISLETSVNITYLDEF